MTKIPMHRLGRTRIGVTLLNRSHVVEFSHEDGLISLTGPHEFWLDLDHLNLIGVDTKAVQKSIYDFWCRG